jgi:hypothetical protein
VGAPELRRGHGGARLLPRAPAAGSRGATTNVSGAVEDRVELACPSAAMPALASQSPSLTATERGTSIASGGIRLFFYSSDMRVPDVIGMVVNMEIYQTLY